MTSRPFQFHPEAELELTEAAEWYEERGAGLGREFLRSVRAKVDLGATTARVAGGRSSPQDDKWTVGSTGK